MTSPWTHPDLLPLFRAEQSAQALLATASDETRQEIETALTDIHRELGQRVALLALDMQSGPTALIPFSMPKPNLHSTKMDTVELELNEPTHSEHELTPIPESTPISDILDEKGHRKLPPPVFDPHSKTIPEIPEKNVDVWKIEIIQTMHLLESPKVLHAYTDIASEMARVLWATHKLESYLAKTPGHIATPLLGLLAARCHHLTTQLETVWGPEIALESMRVVAKNKMFQDLAAFDEPPTTKYQNWFEEAQHWWDVLAHGMQAQLR